jgi:DNA-binding MarR family transcriptional regulator
MWAMPHPTPDHPPAPAMLKLSLGRLERDAAGRLYSPAMRERVARLGAAGPRTETLGALAVADKTVSGLLERAFEQVGLSHAQVKALGIIRHLGDTGAQMRVIAMACNVTPRTTTGVIDGLEAAGLVERVPDPHDRRAVIARLTPEGERRLEAAIALQMQVSERLLAGLDDEEREQLRHLCLRLVEAATMEAQQ